MDDIKALSELASSTAKEFLCGAIFPDEAKAVADAVIALVTAIRLCDGAESIPQRRPITQATMQTEKTVHGTQTVESVSGFGRIVRHTLGRDDSK